MALPGGFGTLEELSELITHLQFRLLNGPLALVNTLGFYDELAGVFERFYRSGSRSRRLDPFLPSSTTPRRRCGTSRTFTPPRLVEQVVLQAWRAGLRAPGGAFIIRAFCAAFPRQWLLKKIRSIGARWETMVRTLSTHSSSSPAS